VEGDQPQGRTHDPRHHRPGEGTALREPAEFDPKSTRDTTGRARLAGILAFATLSIGLSGAGLLSGGCRSTDTDSPSAPSQASQAQDRATPEKPSESQDQITLDAFRDLIQQGAVHPITAIDDDSGFADPKPDTPEEEFDAQAKRVTDKLKGKEGQAPPVAPIGPPPTPENPYLRFGKRIMVYPELGLITKPFPLRVGLGKRMQQLLLDYGHFKIYDPASGPQKPDTVRIEELEKWDQELFSDLRANVPNDGTALNIADWLVVTTGPELLADVENFIDIFAAGVPQIEIEAKIVEVTTTDTLDFGVTPVDSTTPIFGFPDHTFVKSLTYALPNTSGAINSLLTLGGVQDGLKFNAVLQALASYENVSIISRPKIAVREGGRATIVNTLNLPYLAVSGISSTGTYAANVVFQEVGVKLYIVPRVVGTQTVALNIDIESSAQSGSQVVFAVQGGPSITNPIITKRAATTVVYLEPGQAVILGGLISERNVDQENKVPFLGDIPLLGYLFKSTFKRKEQTNVLFFIRPRILQGSDLNREF
jgi:type II secretory pathway component GspD/PulD (secretin)